MYYKIRNLEIDDVDEVCALEEQAFSMPWHRESFIDMINDPNALYMVAVRTGEHVSSDIYERRMMTDSDDMTGDTSVIDMDNDINVSVIGCAGFISIAGEGNICNIVVDKRYHRLGIGERLVRSMIETGKNKFGIEAFTLEVRKSNAAAIGLYEKLGFVCEGIRPGFYDKPKEDACIYWLRL